MSATIHPSFVKGEYFFDKSWQQARSQRARLEAAQHAEILRSLAALGVAEGWRCLVVGGGSGVTVEWLCQRVGRRGSVLATDLAPRFLYGLDYPNLEVCRHDILRDALPGQQFDLVQACLPPQPAAQRNQALARLMRALRPGGWLLVEGPAAQSPAADLAADDEAV